MVYKRRVLGVFTLAMINVAAIISLRNLSIMVEYGFASLFYYILAAIVFFIPTALVCAELATGWPKAGGLYRWVSEAFGKNCGFFAIWVSWMLSISWFPAVLTFTSAAFAYIFMPALIDNKWYMVATMLSTFWLATLINFLGMKASGWVSALGALFGTILPGILMIVLGMLWLILGHPLKIEMSVANLIPHFDPSNMVFFAGVLLAFAGMEMSAYHAREAKHPQQDYPRAILISSVIIILLSILGSLSIAFVVSHHEVSLFAGLMQAFREFFDAFDMDWALPLIAFFAAMGSLAGVNTWIIGPAKGILASAEDGFLPPFLHKLNDRGMPIGTMLFQAIVGSLLTLVFFFMPNANSAFWIITALTIQFAMTMYILIFAAAIRLRYSQPHIVRQYRIPGRNWGIWLVGGMGIVSTLFGFLICYLPPKQIHTGDLLFYEGYLLAGFWLLVIPPFLFMKFKKPHWYAPEGSFTED
ncbi:MAG: amino acid permease [Candidatus Berkiellales bacterium]